MTVLILLVKSRQEWLKNAPQEWGKKKKWITLRKKRFLAKLMEMMKNSYEAEIEYDSPKILLEL